MDLIMSVQIKFAVFICWTVVLSCQRVKASYCTDSSDCSDTEICCNDQYSCCDRKSCSSSANCPGLQNCCKPNYYNSGYCCDSGSSYCSYDSDCLSGYHCCKYTYTKGGFCCVHNKDVDDHVYDYFHLRIGTIVGVALGSIAGFVLLIIGIVCCCKHTVCSQAPIRSIVYSAYQPGVAVVTSSQTNQGMYGQQMLPVAPPEYRPPMPYPSNAQQMHNIPKY